MTDRRDRALRGLDVRGGRGLEIGPLYQPMTRKQDMEVLYVDVQTRERLVEYYSQHPGAPVEDIVEIDFALIDDDGKPQTLAAATAVAAPFDWVLASHVIEHVPDMIGWLADVAAVLADGGMLSLIIPDRRLIHANRAKDPHPSVRAIFDHCYDAASVDAGAVWDRTSPVPPPRMHPLAYVREMLEKSKDPDAHIDCHVWIFSAAEFLEQLATLAELELLEFSV
jgi:SAM-dependent methyltransferase